MGMGGIGACLGTFIYPGIGTYCGEVFFSTITYNICQMESKPLTTIQK